MNAEIKLDIYKPNAEEHTGLYRPQIIVHSCGEYSGMVILEIDGKKYEVASSDLLKAINAVRGI